MALIEARTKYGQVRGVKEEGYTVFKGIPYAKPPVGEGRFAPPEEPERWEGVYEADHFSKIAMQADLEPASFYGKEFYQYPEYAAEKSEDCLYLNIWTPAESTEEKLPVAVWIHGGAFLQGYSHEIEFDGEAYCKRGVILVTINYRLGILGFLTHPWLDAESERGVSGNYGLLDQIAALRWVRENIAEFGGNPENITLFGQSAGCMSVQALVSSPLTEGWISKAILQSAASYRSLLKPTAMADAEKLGEEFMEFAQVESLDKLRSLSARELLEMQNRFMQSRQEMGLLFQPVVDHFVLGENLDILLEREEIKDIPYMLGSTAQDLGTNPQMSEKGLLYYGCISLSRKLESLGRKPAYVYYFTRRPLGDEAGAFHSSELWYMFGTLKRSWRPKEEADYELSGRMLDAWTNFMKYGNPNGSGEEIWKPCSSDEPYVQILDVQET